MKRTLTLRRERLTELSTDELASVVAGAELTPVIKTLPLDDCLIVTSSNCCTGSASC